MRAFFVAVTRNLLSLLGTAITTASAVLILTLFGVQQLGYRGGPYLGILTFLILPGIFVLGLVLIPVGVLIAARGAKRAARRGEPPPSFPVLDLNVDRTRKLVLVFLAFTTVNLVILSLATYKGVEVMDTTEFCGTTCHSVMTPEFTTYQRSPHSRVACVSCHIGPGADWFVKSKLSGSWQLVAVTFNLYPRPIPTPVQSLRPARETCEQCHWPTKFVGDRLKVLTHFAEDEKSTEKDTVLLLRIGGLQGRISQGIHWHVDPSIRIRYRSDPTRERIDVVELTRADGSVDTFTSGEGGKPPAGSDSAAWRVMDCVDCHNRPTHIYRMPQDEIDASIAGGKIDRALPFIRREGLKVLRAAYPSHSEARETIRTRLASFYREIDPGGDASRASRVEAAAKELGDIYCRNVFPSMKITWGTYPSHIGHQNSPGCFRCHDEDHKTSSGKTISQDCSTCHTPLAMEEEKPEILKQLRP